MKDNKKQAKSRSKSKDNKLKLELIKQIACPVKLSKKTSTSKSAKDNTQDDDPKYSVTPKGILYLALAHAVKSDASVDAVDDFCKELLEGLSMLSTQGENKHLFGDDFNEFFSTFVRTMNLCALLKEKLEENGIEFNLDELEGRMGEEE